MYHNINDNSCPHRNADYCNGDTLGEETSTSSGFDPMDVYTVIKDTKQSVLL